MPFPSFRLLVLLLAVLSVGVLRAEDDPLASARKMFEAREYDAAKLLLDVYLEAKPQGPAATEARFYLAESFMSLGKYADAEKNYDLLLKTAPKTTYAKAAEFRLAEMPYLQDKFAVAKPQLEAFIEKYPHDSNLQFVLYYLGEIALRAKSYAEAEHYFRQSVRMFPEGEKNLESRVGLALTLGLDGKKTESVQLFGELATKDERFREMLKDGLLPEAEAFLKSSLYLGPAESKTPETEPKSPQTAESTSAAEPVDEPEEWDGFSVFVEHLPSDESIVEKLFERHPLPKDAEVARIIKGVTKELVGFENISGTNRGDISRFFFKCKVRFIDVDRWPPESLIDPDKDRTDEFTITVTQGDLSGPKLDAVPVPAPVRDTIEERRDEKIEVLPPVDEDNPLRNDPPSDDAVLKRLEEVRPTPGDVPGTETTTRNIKGITKELLSDRLEPPREFPLVGPAQKHRRDFKITVYYEETTKVDWPISYNLKKEDGVEVFYMATENLHRLE